MNKKIVDDQLDVEYLNLEEIINKVHELGLDPKQVKIEAIDIGFYNSQYTPHIVFQRLETDIECLNRYQEECKKQATKEEYERLQYEKLRKKFEKG